MNEPLASTENLLHPRQVVELKEEKARLETMMAAPAFIRNQLADNGAAAGKRAREIDGVLRQAPQPIPKERLDEGVKLESTLRDTWLTGMPTASEMRRNPAGATDKNLAWHKLHKKNVLKWKHLRRRLHASGISTHRLDEESDISNIELYRPQGGAQELNMHNEQIQGKIIQLPETVTPVTVMSDEDEAYLRAVDPEVLSVIGLLDNDQRAEVIGLVRRLRAESKPAKKVRKPKAAKKTRKARTPMSAEQRARMGERLRLGRERAKAKREAQQNMAEG